MIGQWLVNKRQRQNSLRKGRKEVVKIHKAYKKFLETGKIRLLQVGLAT